MRADRPTTVTWRQPASGRRPAAGQVSGEIGLRGLCQLLPSCPQLAKVNRRGPCRGLPGTVPTSTFGGQPFSSRRPQAAGRPWARLDLRASAANRKSTETGRTFEGQPAARQSTAPGRSVSAPLWGAPFQNARQGPQQDAQPRSKGWQSFLGAFGDQ